MGIQGKVRRACEHYGLINAGDSVAAAVSGGKDSLVLLCALAELRSYFSQQFTLTAITLDGRFGGCDTDFSAVQSLCEQLEIPYVIKRTDLKQVVFDIRQEDNPCSLCARMRRGALHDMCVQLGCNKIALGHHMDDAIETFFMNLFREGRIGCFSPITYLSRKDITQIRPLIFCEESEVAGEARRLSLPVVKSGCPRDGASERESVKRFVAEKQREMPDFRTKVFGALMRAHINGL